MRRIAETNPNVSCFRSHLPLGFGHAVRAGLDRYTGDAVAIMMADLSDSPEDLVLYYRVLEQGYDCAFGSRFGQGGSTSRLPTAEARPQPDRQRGHPDPVPPRLQRHDQRFQGLPARGDRPAPAAALQPLQPDRRDAAEGGRPRLQLRGGPGLLDQPPVRRRRSCSFRRWAAATYSSSSTCGSRRTSAAATIGARTCPPALHPTLVHLESSQVSVDHAMDELLEAEHRLPTESLVGTAWVSDVRNPLWCAHQAGIDSDIPVGI